MLEAGDIELGDSDYTSTLILAGVPEKKPRPCIDHRRLNLIIKNQTRLIMSIEERAEVFSRAKYVSTLDLVSGY